MVLLGSHFGSSTLLVAVGRSKFCGFGSMGVYAQKKGAPSGIRHVCVIVHQLY